MDFVSDGKFEVGQQEQASQLVSLLQELYQVSLEAS